MRRTLVHAFKAVSNDEICVYCGDVAGTIDHFVPYSFVNALVAVLDAGETIDGRMLVPACAECNRLAGNTLFRTIAAKRRYIQDKLRKRYAKLLTMPDWGEDELADLDYSLRHFIEGSLLKRDWIIDRLRWRNTSNAAAVKLGQIRFGQCSTARTFKRAR